MIRRERGEFGAGVSSCADYGYASGGVIQFIVRVIFHIIFEAAGAVSPQCLAKYF